MAKRIVFTRPDGGVSIVSPSPRFLATFNTEADGLAAVKAKDVPVDAVDVVTINAADMPADRTFRDAWRQAAGVFSIDMPKAQIIQTSRIDAARREKARDLIEREMMGEDVTAEKVTLQAINATAQIAAAQTPAALKAIWPMGL